MTLTRLYRLVCRAIPDEWGLLVAGCGLTLTSPDRTTACPICGEVMDVEPAGSLPDLHTRSQ